MFHMHLDRAIGNGETGRDRLVAHARGDIAQHFLLAGGEAVNIPLLFFVPVSERQREHIRQTVTDHHLALQHAADHGHHVIRHVVLCQESICLDIDRDVALMGLKRMDVDALGLDELDRSVLRAIIEMYGGGPVGLDTLAAALGEESVTLEDICEPYLMQMGMLTRTPRGRCVTRLAYEHLHMAVPRRFDDTDNGQQSMF